MGTLELILCWLGAIAGPPLLWIMVRRRLVWPNEDEVPSAAHRRLFGWSGYVFFGCCVAYAVLRLVEHYALVSPGIVTVLGALLAVPFFGACVLLIWYRVTRRW